VNTLPGSDPCPVILTIASAENPYRQHITSYPHGRASPPRGNISSHFQAPYRSPTCSGPNPEGQLSAPSSQPPRLASSHDGQAHRRRITVRGKGPKGVSKDYSHHTTITHHISMRSYIALYHSNQSICSYRSRASLYVHTWCPACVINADLKK
jgi:hypothetical protein